MLKEPHCQSCYSRSGLWCEKYHQSLKSKTDEVSHGGALFMERYIIPFGKCTYDYEESLERYCKRTLKELKSKKEQKQ